MNEIEVERKQKDLARLKRNIDDDAKHARRQHADEETSLEEEASIATQISLLQGKLLDG